MACASAISPPTRPIAPDRVDDDDHDTDDDNDGDDEYLGQFSSC